jgi:membrane-bound lytic murein transglycosylase D
MPPILVVPMNGASIDTGARLPLMYAPPIPVAATRTQVHTVKAGETLISIAGRYKVTPDDLRRWNPIGRLTVGQQLRIQTASPAPAPAARTPANRANKSFPVKGKTATPKVKGKVKKQRH